MRNTTKRIKLSELTKTSLLICSLSLLIALMPKSVNAAPIISTDPVYQLDVTYTNGSIASGPLSFGLSELPTTVSALFMLDSGTIGLNGIDFFSSNVISANVNFGDTTWTESLLDNFSMSLSSGNVSSLSYAFLPAISDTVDGPIVLNFPLSITGTDINSGESFSYGYAESTQTISSAVPEPSTLLLMSLGLAGFGLFRQRNKIS